MFQLEVFGFSLDISDPASDDDNLPLAFCWHLLFVLNKS
jgi:hypothetical protein